MSDTTIDSTASTDTSEAPVASPDDATADQNPTTDTPEPPEDEQRGGNREAAKYRTQLRAAEAERDQLRDQLTAQRRSLIDWRAAGNGPNGTVQPELLDAAGLDVDMLIDTETGQLDMNAVDQFIGATAQRFNIARGFTPNRGQGASGNGTPPSKPSIADAFKPPGH
ncbi:hypothetical protein XA26_10780 [Mycolicibacterium fortuitum]|uniref:Scaffolding protein n=1 Tax=Mycolicibacterium fortuitum TaxID=1766 RepID=A0A0N7H812_MYCFO|nr:hypothetical protein [Mycolicibacterium fortuitum]ALI24935.1 hypothetical protein XA26_10780 [Mycolicibacterium fortuitum]